MSATFPRLKSRVRISSPAFTLCRGIPCNSGPPDDRRARGRVRFRRGHSARQPSAGVPHRAESLSSSRSPSTRVQKSSARSWSSTKTLDRLIFIAVLLVSPIRYKRTPKITLVLWPPNSDALCSAPCPPARARPEAPELDCESESGPQSAAPAPGSRNRRTERG